MSRVLCALTETSPLAVTSDPATNACTLLLSEFTSTPAPTPAPSATPSAPATISSCTSSRAATSTVCAFAAASPAVWLISAPFRIAANVVSLICS